MIRNAVQLCLPLLLAGCLFAADSASSKDALTATGGQATVEATTLTLDEAVQEALAHNPAVQAASHMVAAQRARIPQAKAWPEPTVGIGWMGNIQPFSVQTGDPSSYRSASAMQMVPFPGKQRLKGEVAAKEADAAQWDAEATRRRLTADVKTAYYDYWFYDRALLTTRRNKDLLTKMSQISEARYRVGKGLQQDVLKSQVEISMLLQKLTMLEQQRATAQARLNTLLARDPDAPLPPPADIRQAALTTPLEQLYKLARQNDTELQRDARMAERNQLAANLAQKDSLPDLSVGYMYQQRPMMPDMHGMTFTVSLPVFYKSRQREAVRQATEEQLSAERSRDNRQNELFFELKQAYLAAKASDTLLKLYSQAVVPQSSLALESAMSAYQVGSADFLTVLGNFSTVLNYETEYYREMASYQGALVKLESLTGVELTNTPAAPQTAMPPQER